MIYCPFLTPHMTKRRSRLLSAAGSISMARMSPLVCPTSAEIEAAANHPVVGPSSSSQSLHAPWGPLTSEMLDAMKDPVEKRWAMRAFWLPRLLELIPVLVPDLSDGAGVDGAGVHSELAESMMDRILADGRRDGWLEGGATVLSAHSCALPLAMKMFAYLFDCNAKYELEVRMGA